MDTSPLFGDDRPRESDQERVRTGRPTDLVAFANALLARPSRPIRTQELRRPRILFASPNVLPLARKDYNLLLRSLRDIPQGATVIPHSLEKSHFDPNELSKYDGLISGGGISDVRDNLPHHRNLAEIIEEAIGIQLPTVGICLTHQKTSAMYDGTVEKNPYGWRFGNPPSHLTADAAGDPLFAGIPREFNLTSTNRFVVTKPPKGAVSTITDERSGHHHGLRLGEVFWTIQSHPEADTRNIAEFARAKRAKLRLLGVDIPESDVTVIPGTDMTIGRKILENFVNIVRSRMKDTLQR